MSIVYNQKKASDLIVSGRHMREAWINGEKIWPEVPDEPDRFGIWELVFGSWTEAFCSGDGSGIRTCDRFTYTDYIYRYDKELKRWINIPFDKNSRLFEHGFTYYEWSSDINIKPTNCDINNNAYVTYDEAPVSRWVFSKDAKNWTIWGAGEDFYNKYIANSSVCMAITTNGKDILCFFESWRAKFEDADFNGYKIMYIPNADQSTNGNTEIIFTESDYPYEMINFTPYEMCDYDYDKLMIGATYFKPYWILFNKNDFFVSENPSGSWKRLDLPEGKTPKRANIVNGRCLISMMSTNIKESYLYELTPNLQWNLLLTETEYTLNAKLCVYNGKKYVLFGDTKTLTSYDCKNWQYDPLLTYNVRSLYYGSEYSEYRYKDFTQSWACYIPDEGYYVNLNCLRESRQNCSSIKATGYCHFAFYKEEQDGN